MSMRSMTGCGSSLIQRDGWEVSAELKTVNHRFLDISMRLPRNISFLEQIVRKTISEKINRGHVDVYITVKKTAGSAATIVVDQDLAKQYYEAGKELSRKLGAQNDLGISKLISLEGVTTLTDAEMDQDLVCEICADAVAQAALHVVDMREHEGIHLKEDLQTHLNHAAQIREKILERAPYVVSEYKEKLENRLKMIIAEGVDAQRLALEVAIMADHCAIDEELSRLESHIKQMHRYLGYEEELGNKMDFLIQEMNREANTIGSKVQDEAISQYVVDLKSEIEKLREQIQNVE